MAFLLTRGSLPCFTRLRSYSKMAQVISLKYQGPVAVLKMQNGENRFTKPFFRQFLSALDEVESKTDIKALVTTGEGKFYSNGLDLDGMASYTQEEIHHLFNVDLHALFKRMLTYPIVTIAAINGHSFAAGGLLALTHDYRVMRRDRGWFCLPEMQIKMPFTVSLMEIAKARLPPSEYANSILFGKRYTAEEGERAGIIQETAPEEKVLERAISRGVSVAQEDLDRNTLSEMKKGLNYAAIKALSEPEIQYSKL